MSPDLLDRDLISDWPHRVCLPHCIDLLQLARWVNAANEGSSKLHFDFVAGQQHDAWSGTDAIELFSEIQRRCVNNSLSHSYVACRELRSIMFFDKYGRFGFFSAELEVLRNLYPFSQEIMWENFLLLQEEDDDTRPAEIFESVQSV